MDGFSAETLVPAFAGIAAGATLYYFFVREKKPALDHRNETEATLKDEIALFTGTTVTSTAVAHTAYTLLSRHPGFNVMTGVAYMAIPGIHSPNESVTLPLTLRNCCICP